MNITPEQLALLPMWYVAFLLSLTCHEGSHALTARLGGDPTASKAGQASLNPIPHILREPMGTIVFPLITYFFSGWMMGWASAPFDPAWQRRYPRRAAAMALAGPAANFLLAAIAGVGLRIGYANGAFARVDGISLTQLFAAPQSGIAEGAARFLSILFTLNVLLGTFNLIPLPPLDGASVITIAMPHRLALRYLELSYNRTFALIGLVVAWQICNPLFGPVYGIALDLLYLGVRT